MKHTQKTTIWGLFKGQTSRGRELGGQLQLVFWWSHNYLGLFEEIFWMFVWRGFVAIFFDSVLTFLVRNYFYDYIVIWGFEFFFRNSE